MSFGLLVATWLLAGCARERTGAPVTIRSLTGPPLLIDEAGAGIVPERHVIARIWTRALAADADRLYFGAGDDLSAVPKRGGAKVTIGYGAPLEIAVGERVAWIGAPGNVLLASSGRPPGDVLMRTAGRFTDVAADGPDVFVTDALRSRGALLRVNHSTMARVATFDFVPLEVTTDANNAYVLSEQSLLAVPRKWGAPRTLFQGQALRELEIAGAFAIVTDVVGSSRRLLRIPTAGDAPMVLERAVREGPVAVFADKVYFLDPEQPALRRVSVQGGPSMVVARAPDLASVSELVVDASGIYVATEDDRGAVILGLPLPP